MLRAWRGATARRFRSADRVSIPTVPHLCRDGFIPSCDLSSSESLSPASRADLRSSAPPCRGFLPSSRLHRRCPRLQEVPSSRCVPSSGFLGLSTACSTFGFAGLFHPAATSRVSVQGFLPRPVAASTHRRPFPPCPSSLARSPVARLPPACDWTSRSFSTGRFVRRGRGLAFLDAAPLFGFHPPPGTRSRAVPGRPGSAPDLTAGISSTPS